MESTVASCVVADIYQGLDLPAGWADRPTTLDIGLAHDHVISVIVALDANVAPLAACWRISDADEQFVCARSGNAEPNLLDALDDDLASASSRLGTADLLATLVWEPTALRPDQGEYLRKIVFVSAGPAYGDMRGWNEATRAIVAEAPRLIPMRRKVIPGLDLSAPETAQALHAIAETDDDARFFLVNPRQPGEVAARADWKDTLTTKVMTLVWASLIAAIAAGAWIFKLG